MNIRSTNHIAFNDDWLIVMQPGRIDAFALQGRQLYDKHLSMPSPFSIFPWRRPKFGSIGLYNNTLWTFTTHGNNQVKIHRYSIGDYGFIKEGVFSGADEEWDNIAVFFYAIGPHQVLVQEDNMPHWTVMRERIYRNELVVVELPYLSSYAIINKDGVPYPIMYNRSRLIILDQRLNVMFSHDFNKPILDATVDRCQGTCCCLMSDVIIVIHINTGRVLKEIPVNSSTSFRVIWSQDGIIGAYSHHSASVCVFDSNGYIIEPKIPGRLLVSNQGVAVLQGNHVVVMFARSGIHQFMAKNINTPPVGVFVTPSNWLLLSLPT